MTRLSLDATILQSRCHNGQEITISAIALEIFGKEICEGERVASAVAMSRAINASRNLIALRRAVPIPSIREMTAIRITYASEGTQLQSLMNMAAREGHRRRVTDPQEPAPD